MSDVDQLVNGPGIAICGACVALARDPRKPAANHLKRFWLPLGSIGRVAGLNPARR
jgi:hypothetical protein